MIVLEVNNVVYSNFDTAQVVRDLETISGSFKFTAFTDSTRDFPFQAGQACRVLATGEDARTVDFGISEFGVADTAGVPLITGFIDAVEIEYSSQSHSISIRGRDKTADIVDSTLGDNVELSTGITLQQTIREILSRAKIPGIEVFNQVRSLNSLTIAEQMSAEPGTTVFDFIEKYARKFQVLVTTDGRGNVVLTRAEVQFLRFTLNNTFTDPERNNIKSASIKRDDSNRFRNYFVHSQGNTASSSKFDSPGLARDQATNPTPSGSVEDFVQADLNEIVQARQVGIDDAMRSSRTLHVVTETSSTTDQCRDRAQWQADINRARAFTYKAVVQGFVDPLTKQVWNVNELVQVNDVFAGLQQPLLITAVKYSLSVDQGSETELTLVNPDAYKLLDSEPVLAKANAAANNFPDAGTGTAAELVGGGTSL